MLVYNLQICVPKVPVLPKLPAATPALKLQTSSTTTMTFSSEMFDDDDDDEDDDEDVTDTDDEDAEDGDDDSCDDETGASAVTNEPKPAFVQPTIIESKEASPPDQSSSAQPVDKVQSGLPAKASTASTATGELSVAKTTIVKQNTEIASLTKEINKNQMQISAQLKTLQGEKEANQELKLKVMTSFYNH